MYEKVITPALPKAFVERRLHSLTGFFLVLFLLEHLLTNSQAALFIGDDGSGFVQAVNFIQSLPYLPVIEITLLGIPFLLHGWWGIRYLKDAKYNSFSSDGTKPALPQYPRNHAYTWQRITSLILVAGILLHVVYMRFIKYPVSAERMTSTDYMVRITNDEGLLTLSKRLGVRLYDRAGIEEAKLDVATSILELPPSPQAVLDQEIGRRNEWLAKLERYTLTDNQVVAVAPSFGTAALLSVRDAFQSVWICVLYTLFVLAACFHAMNGIWTFAISWGITISPLSQRGARHVSNAIMALIMFLGLAAIWGTYFLNLKN